MSNLDFDDQRQLSGLESIKAIIHAKLDNMGTPLEGTTAAEKRVTWTLKDLLSMAPPKMLVQSLLAMMSFASLTGPTGSLKSFFAIALAFSVATGQEFYGRRVAQGGVLIIAGEGVFGLRARFRALMRKHRITEIPDNLHVRGGLNLLDIEEMNGLRRFIEENDIKLVIVDTLARSFIGDENSAKDLGAAIRSIDEHIINAGAACLVVHHTGHGAQDRARGSSAYRAALDTEIGVERTEDVITVKCWKSKDFEPFEPMSFKAEVVETMDFDEDGRVITSLVLEPCTFQNRAKALSKQEAELWEVLKDRETPFVFADVRQLAKERTSISRNHTRVVESLLLKLEAAGQVTRSEGIYEIRGH